MTGSHYPPLVIVSAIVAILASYTALDLSGRVAAARGIGRRLWLLGGSIAMGVGIWSMHFIAMLAFRLPMPIRYNIPIWLASVAIAIVASLLALTVVSRPHANVRSLLAAAPLMGLAIAGMHYTGMTAIRVQAELHYAPILVIASIAVAVVASFVALYLALLFRERSGQQAAMGKALSAVVMGLAICGMHYTAMFGASFHAVTRPGDLGGPELLATRGLALTVTLGSLLILGLSLAGARIDRRIRRELALSAESADAKLKAEIGERLEIQERLRQSNESYRSLFDSLTELVFVLDGAGRFIDVNDAVEGATGYHRTEIVGGAADLFIDPAAVGGQSLANRFRFATLGRPQQFESRGQCKDGTSFPIEVVLSQANYFGERAVLAVARDITDRKRAETELAAAEAHYRRLVETSPFGIFSCDLSGALVELNPAAERILDNGEVIGQRFVELVATDDQPLFEAALHDLRDSTKRSTEAELRIRRPSGELRLLALTLTEVRDPGVPPAIHGIARDITVERLQEEQLRRAERLAGVGTLIGGVAHELNNPLTAIHSFAELMLQDERSVEDREALETMRRESSRAARIVSDLRLVARATQDDASKERQVVDMNDVVRHVVKLRAYALATHNVDVREELDPRLPSVLGDRGQLEQVILNLVVNAGQAMESSPNRRLLVRTRAEGSSVIVEVGDTGMGIAPQDLDRIFDPFWTTKAPGDGTGLGLSLVHSLVSDHSGTIRVNSRPGTGTTFVLSFPGTEQRNAPGASAAPGVLPSVKPLRVLLVEDEAGIRRVLQQYLRRRGHEVDVAAEGAEALELIAANGNTPGYHVIISDLRMPGLSGDQLLEKLEKAGNGLHRRIVFISGDAASPQAARMMEAAALPILYKPFGLQELASLVEEFAEQIGRVDHSTPGEPAPLLASVTA